MFVLFACRVFYFFYSLLYILPDVLSWASSLWPLLYFYSLLYILPPVMSWASSLWPLLNFYSLLYILPPVLSWDSSLWPLLCFYSLLYILPPVSPWPPIVFIFRLYICRLYFSWVFLVCSYPILVFPQVRVFRNKVVSIRFSPGRDLRHWRQGWGWGWGGIRTPKSSKLPKQYFARKLLTLLGLEIQQMSINVETYL